MTKEKLKNELMRMYVQVQEDASYNKEDRYWKGKARAIEDIYRMMFKKNIEEE